MGKKGKKLIVLGLALVMSLTLAVYGSVAALASELELLPPSILPVVILAGSDYEMGYQYGQQAGQYMELGKEDRWVTAFTKFGTVEKILRELMGFQYYMEEYTPEVIEMMKGMADGATAAGYDVSYTDVLLSNSGLGWQKVPNPTTSYPPGAEDQEIPPGECSVFSVWGNTTTDGKLICGKSNDGSYRYNMTLVAFPDNGNNILGVAFAGELWPEGPTMNNKGVFIAGSSNPGRRDEDYDYGIAEEAMYQHIMRFADSASEAKDMLLSWQLPYGLTQHISDVTGDAYVAETTAAITRIRKPGDFGEGDFLYSTNNFFIADMPLKETDKFIEHAGWGTGSSIPRNLQMYNMFSNYQGKVDADFAKMMWRFPGNPPPEPPDGGWQGCIGKLSNEWISVVLADDGDEGVAYLCNGPAAGVIWPKGRGRYGLIAGTRSFYKLTLASSAEKVVSEAYSQARSDISKAYHALSELNYTDTGYAALNEIYSQANTEYYQGVNARNKARLAESRNEALLYFSKAATAFTRTQAHALQVYNALVPPATCPEELGLSPYGGAWGSWEGQTWTK